MCFLEMHSLHQFLAGKQHCMHSKEKPQQGPGGGGRGMLGLLIFETTTHPVTASTMIKRELRSRPVN
jgi:hypothetical protein